MIINKINCRKEDNIFKNNKPRFLLKCLILDFEPVLLIRYSKVFNSLYFFTSNIIKMFATIFNDFSIAINKLMQKQIVIYLNHHLKSTVCSYLLKIQTTLLIDVLLIYQLLLDT